MAQRLPNIDPHGSMDYGSGVVCSQIFQPPFAWLRASDNLAPVLFEGPLRSTPGKAGHYTGKLRNDILFSDGSPMTAADLKASLEAHWAREHGATISSRGDDITFQLREHRNEIEQTLCSSWCGVAKKVGDKLIGTGPYMLADRPSEDEILLVRNPHYRGQQGEATIQEILLTSYAPDGKGDFSALLQAIRDGKVDFTTVLPRDAARTLEGVRKIFQPGSSTSLLFLNCERGPFADAELRRALARCIDRHQLTSLCYENPSGFVARSVLPPRMGRYNDGIIRESASEAVLKEGVKRPLELLVIWGPRPYLSEPKAVADDIKGQLGALGVQVDVHQATDVDDYFARSHAGKCDMVLTGWIADSADATSFLDALLNSNSIPNVDEPSAIASNMSRWRDAECDELLARYRRTGDANDQRAILDRVASEVPVLPICYGPSVTVASWDLDRFEPHPLGILPYFSEFSFASRSRPPSSSNPSPSRPASSRPGSSYSRPFPSRRRPGSSEPGDD
jgi:peptide/nickel transport system substrate-binding protein